MTRRNRKEMVNCTRNADRTTIQNLRAIGPRQASRRNAQPAPKRGCSKGVGSAAPNKRNERPASGRAFHFCKVGPTLPCQYCTELPVCFGPGIILSSASSAKIVFWAFFLPLFRTFDTNNPVFQFMDKKRAERKRFYDCTMVNTTQYIITTRLPFSYNQI